MLSEPASMSTIQLPIWYLGNTVLKHILHKNCHRSNRSSLTIYAIVFYTGFSPALKIQKSVMFLHFTDSHKSPKKLNQIYFINGILNDKSEGYSKEYSCLTKNYHHTQACDNYYTKLYITN